MTTRKIPPKVHTYPSKYPPGTNWATDAAWELLDYFVPGVISDDNRALLAGMIAGRLVRERDRAARIAMRGGSRHIAEAIRDEH